MTDLLPELGALPVAGTFDGELVALGEDGAPDFPLLCERMLIRRRGIVVTYVVFDLLRLDGRDLTGAPYFERRAELQALNLNGVYWQTPETLDDGPALFEAVCAHGLEGVVAKRRAGRYRPGERCWVKTKNREYWRYDMERESAINSRRQRRSSELRRTAATRRDPSTLERHALRT